MIENHSLFLFAHGMHFTYMFNIYMLAGIVLLGKLVFKTH